MNPELLTALSEGRVRGFSGAPTLVPSVMSRVFIFASDDRVLKFYRRDNDWWNRAMSSNLAGGPEREAFIREDFAYNHFLNPEVYLELKSARLIDGVVELIDPCDDELVIVMKCANFGQTFTNVLGTADLDYVELGRTFATAKLAMQQAFPVTIAEGWYERMTQNLQDVSTWALQATAFTPAREAIRRFERGMAAHQKALQSLGSDQVFPLIDSNPENLLFDGRLHFVDIYPPKANWRSGSFDVDTYRIAVDIAAFAGLDAARAFLMGVRGEASSYLHPEQSDIFLMYGILITGPYLFMLAEKDPRYLARAEQYRDFATNFVESGTL